MVGRIGLYELREAPAVPREIAAVDDDAADRVAVTAHIPGDAMDNDVNTVLDRPAQGRRSGRAVDHHAVTASCLTVRGSPLLCIEHLSVRQCLRCRLLRPDPGHKIPDLHIRQLIRRRLVAQSLPQLSGAVAPVGFRLKGIDGGSANACPGRSADDQKHKVRHSPSTREDSRAAKMAAVHGCRSFLLQPRSGSSPHRTCHLGTPDSVAASAALSASADQRFTIYFARAIRTDAPWRTPRSRVASSVTSPRILTGL